MNTCPNCYSECEDNFDTCWNCQYSFTEKRILENTELSVICPKCKTKSNATMEYCPKCSEKLEVNWQAGHPDVMEGKMKINCLRCQVPMSMKGKFKFHAGTHLGPVERPFEIWINRVPFDLYFCPKCGKIEFFLPDEKNAF